MSSKSVSVSLAGIPETMLWTLHNRAAEALLKTPLLIDEQAVKIYRSINYDFEQHFGKPDGSHALRSKVFDEVMADWLQRNPEGVIVELGCGLETQYQRIDNGTVDWFCVDVPEAIEIRECFIRPAPRCHYVKSSALCFRWMDWVPTDKAVFVSAQGLLMYFEPTQVHTLLRAMSERFKKVELMFDTIPRWFSQQTLRGYRKTASYTTPPMPWGVDINEIVETLSDWGLRLDHVDITPYGPTHGWGSLMLPLFSAVPVLRNRLPAIVHTRITPNA